VNNVVVHLLAVYGVTFLLKDATIFSGVRTYLTERSSFIRRLLSCPYCVGFYSGSFVYLVSYEATGSLVSFCKGLLLYALSGITVSGFLDYTLLCLERHSGQE